MKPKFIVVGFILWLAATLSLRFVGQWVISNRGWLNVMVLFAISFVAMALLLRLACIRARLAPHDWPGAAVSLLLPTLLLDPFSSAFFPVVFPNMAPENAGVFGGWMIVCCAGGLLGALIRGSRQPHESAQPS
jgi:fucose permease